MSIIRSGDITVELATQSQIRLFFYVNLSVLGNFMFLLEDFRYWYQYIIQIIRLIAK